MFPSELLKREVYTGSYSAALQSYLSSRYDNCEACHRKVSKLASSLIPYVYTRYVYVPSCLNVGNTRSTLLY